MKRIYTLLFILTSIVPILLAQKTKEEDLIEINTKFIFKLETSDSIHYSFKIEKKEIFNQTVNLTEIQSLFDKNIENGYIHGIFTYGKFGNKTSCLLLMKNGVKQSLNYELKIKVDNKENPIKTSVVSLHPNVVATEIWPYDIEYIFLSDFESVKQSGQQIDYSFSEPVRDLTCIKNRQNNSQFTDSLFANYIDTLNASFLSPDGLKLSVIMDYEKRINSIDITRNHTVSIGEGIYPNKKKYKLTKPLTYKNIECPYLQLETDYYYTEGDNSVKVILFEWNEFKEKKNSFEKGIEIAEKDKIFKEKFSKIENELTELLGKPTRKKIGSKKSSENYRDDVKWLNKKGMKAYLFMFGNNTSYRQIRLAVYYQ